MQFYIYIYIEIYFHNKIKQDKIEEKMYYMRVRIVPICNRNSYRTSVDYIVAAKIN